MSRVDLRTKMPEPIPLATALRVEAQVVIIYHSQLLTVGPVNQLVVKWLSSVTGI
jgi:hypothetical protein